MQIKIDAQDMLCVLVDAGIDETDAKAIIFDLLQLPESGSSERQSLLEARKSRLKSRIEKKKKELDEDDEEYVLDESNSKENKKMTETEDKSETPLKKGSIKKPKRVSFSAFGGTAPPLR